MAANNGTPATAVGRIVWGHPLKPTNKLHQEDGATWRKGDQVRKQDGTPVVQWIFGLAIPKAEFDPIYQAMMAEAGKAYPSGFPARFAWKFRDGDGVDPEGKPYGQREGYAGCFILTISTEAFCPPLWRFDGNSYTQMAVDEVRCGDYIAASVNFVVNPATGTKTPSLYVNPVGLQFVGYGKEIVGASANPNEIFKGQQFAMPAGASAQPTYSQPAGYAPPSGAPGAPPAYGQPPQQPPAYGAPGAPPAYGQPPQQPPAYGQPPQQPPAYGAPGAAPGGYPPPAPDFVTGAPPQQPGYASGGYAPQPGQPGYAPAPGGYMPPR